MRSNIHQAAVNKQANGLHLDAPVEGRFSAEKFNCQSGFTLIELVTVMVIVGVLAVSVLPRFFTVSDFEDRGSADQVKSMLRFAQKAAIAQHTLVNVKLAQGASPDCTTTLTGGNLTCTVKSALTGAGVYTFNALGQLTAPAAPATVTIGGTTITIEAETGYVH